VTDRLVVEGLLFRSLFDRVEIMVTAFVAAFGRL